MHDHMIEPHHGDDVTVDRKKEEDRNNQINSEVYGAKWT